jgi:hypothetical protein
VILFCLKDKGTEHTVLILNSSTIIFMKDAAAQVRMKGIFVGGGGEEGRGNRHRSAADQERGKTGNKLLGMSMSEATTLSPHSRSTGQL